MRSRMHVRTFLRLLLTTVITTVKKEETSMGVWTFDMVGDGEDEADQVLSPELIG